MARLPFSLCVLAFSGCASSGAPASGAHAGVNDSGPPALDSGDPDARANVAVPGTCRGTGTTCEQPTVEPVALPAISPCTTTAVDGAAIVWSAELGDVDCSIGRCRLVYPLISGAPDGSVWVVADLRPPPPEPSSGDSLGRAIVHFDANGTRLGTRVIETSQRGGAAPTRAPSSVLGSIQGLRAVDDGRLLLAMPNATGDVTLEEYAATADPLSTRTLVDGVHVATAAIAQTGDITLVYAYDSDHPPSKTFVTEHADVARFAPNGTLQWVQSAAKSFELTPTSRPRIALLESTGGSIIHLARADIQSAAAAIEAGVVTHPGDVPVIRTFERLTEDGNIAWARALPNADNMTAIALGEHLFASLPTTVTSGQGEHAELQVFEIGADGTISARVDVPELVGGGSSYLVLSGVDATGRLLVTDMGQSPVELAIPSSDGKTCSVMPVDLPFMDEAGTNMEISLVPAGADVAFATILTVGVLHLPVLP